MITEIYVNGFKSLMDFSMKINPGINVLVGSNGAGKTNIVQFIEFISVLFDDGVSRAISQFGGAGAIFHKTGEQNYDREIDFKIFGSIQKKSKQYIYYEYYGTIALTESGDKVYLAKQQFRLKRRTVPTEGKISVKKISWDFDLGIDCSKIDKNILTAFSFKEEKLQSRFPLGRNKSKDNYYLALKNDLENEDFRNENIFYSIYRVDDSIRDIRHDLSESKVYNINPQAVRIPDDGAIEPGIEKTGSGLYATLYDISTAKEKRYRGASSYGLIRFRNRNFSSLRGVTMNKVLEYIKLANESIESLSVVNDPFTNQLQLKVGVKNDEGNMSSILPFSSLSDGTVKWICLVTLMLTNPSIACIEEPENFLHPRMQSLFVDIVRNHITESSPIILTTHSESLLNAIEPNEIICVRFENGRTKASNPENIEDLRNEMNETGFGLGYYYVSDGVV